jgi:hypothetical protein
VKRSLVPLVVVAAVSLGACTNSANQAAGQPKAAVVPSGVPTTSRSFIFAGAVRDTSSYNGCNLTISPLRTGSSPTSDGAQRAFASFERGSPGAMYSLIEYSESQARKTVTPTVGYAAVSDPDYGAIVNGRVRPVFWRTPEWVIEYRSVPLIDVSGTPGHSPGTHMAVQTVIVLVHPVNDVVLNSSLC